MSRSLTRILVVLLTALLLATRARADSAAGSILDGYGLFALDGLRTRGFGSMANVGVNDGTFHSQGATNATGFTVAASTVHLGDGTKCAHLFANVVTKSAAGCGPAPEHGVDRLLGTVDPSDDCGIAKPFPACGGPGVGVTHGSTLTLAAGKYGDALVEGGGQGPGTLILTGGRYEFCNLHLSRYARLLVKGPSEIYVNGEVSFSNQTTFGPAPGPTIVPRDLKLFVNGARVRFARQANVTGKVCAPHGALFMTEASKLTGCALAQRIRTDHVTVKGECQTGAPPTTTTTTSTTSTITTTSSSSTSSSTSTSTTSTTGTIEVSTTTTTTSTTPTTIRCGNDQLDPGEECDPGLPVTVVCEGSAGGALETACPLCRAAGTEGECTIDCSCCPTGKCASTTTSSTTLPTTTSTSTTSSSTSSTAPQGSTSTSSSSSTVTSNPPSTSSSTTSSTIESTTSTLVTTTSTSTTSSSTSSTTTTMPTFPPPTQLDLTITTGTTNCGGPVLTPVPSPPFSGEVDDGTGANIGDLGQGCLCFGSGQNKAIACGVIPTGSTSFFKIASTNVDTLTLGGATGPATSCTKGTGPAKHCLKGEKGTDGHGACASDANCLSALGAVNVGSCVLDANCYFGPPLSIPNRGSSTCVINVIATDVTGTADAAAGTMSVNLPLASRVYLTGTSYDDTTTTTVTEACPRCINNACSGGPSAGIYPFQGRPCATTAPGLTSIDCPPAPDKFLATLPISLNPFTTSSTQIANLTTGLICPGQVTPNTGAFGKNLTRTVKEHGAPAGDLRDRAAHLGSLASTFCIPPTGNAIVDPAGGLPGPGAFSIAASIKIE